MGKKTYAKPFFVVEKFTAQEYCAPCNNPSITTLHETGYSYLYLDLTKEGNFTKSAGERFYNGKNTSSGTDRIIYDVDALYVQYKSYGNWYQYSGTPQDGVSYNPGHEFDYNYQGKVTTLKFTKKGTYDIKIVDHYAYIYNKS